MKIAFGILVTSYLFMGSAAHAASSTETWSTKADSSKFVEKVVKVCQKYTNGSVLNKDGSIQITESPGCLKDLKIMFQRWEKAPKEDVAAISTQSPSLNQAVYTDLQKSVPISLLKDTGVLKFSKECPCVAFMGGHALEVVKMAKEKP